MTDFLVSRTGAIETDNARGLEPFGDVVEAWNQRIEGGITPGEFAELNQLLADHDTKPHQTEEFLRELETEVMAASEDVANTMRLGGAPRGQEAVYSDENQEHMAALRQVASGLLAFEIAR
ncbi:MAG: hypothetical protein AAFQ82_01685 [Myxococcota bacterium]